MNKDMNEIIVTTEGGITATFDDFISKLPMNDCRYAIIDFYYSNDTKHKYIFIFW